MPQNSGKDAMRRPQNFCVSRGRSMRLVLSVGWSLVTLALFASGLVVLFLSPVTVPPVDRGHAVRCDQWGCE